MPFPPSLPHSLTQLTLSLPLSLPPPFACSPLLRAASLSKFLPVVRDPNKSNNNGSGSQQQEQEQEIIAR
jgi:hypothetical protein